MEMVGRNRRAVPSRHGGQPPGRCESGGARDRQGAGAEKETLAASRMKEATSVGVRKLSLAAAGFAFDGIDFAARLYRLHHHGEACSIARNARMLFDLWCHLGPFRPATEAALLSSFQNAACLRVRLLVR